MTLYDLVTTALDKTNFRSITDYLDFSRKYLDFSIDGLQAVIVSQNENNYQFYQYRQEGHYNITRPLNSDLMLTAAESLNLATAFLEVMSNVRDIPENDNANRHLITKVIYTVQQCIGATLDALPSGASNTARKISGDLFERWIQLLIQYTGIRCQAGTVQVPIEVEGVVQLKMSYQHDLLIYSGEELKAVGSVKTSSKDRLGKIWSTPGKIE